MPDTVSVPPNCQGDVEIEISGILFVVKIRKQYIVEYGSPEKTEVPIFHVAMFPLVTEQEYEYWCDNTVAITNLLLENIQEVVGDTAKFAIVNMVDWQEFLQY